MKVSDFLELYRLDGLVQTIAEHLRTNQNVRLQIKGLVGSQDAVLASALYTSADHHHVFVLHDKEEAAYFLSDLQALIGDQKTPLLFPTSYKKAYQFDETENANILMRAEALNQLEDGIGHSNLSIRPLPIL